MRPALRGLWAAVALALALAPAGHALDPARRITQYIHRVWTQEDGLPQDTVRAIAQTPDGYLWIGTEEGLASFDGYDFRPFNRRSGTLPNDSVTALGVGGDGKLWAGTPGGLVSYKEGVWRTLGRAEGLADASILSIAAGTGAAGGQVWVVAGGTLYEVSGGRARAAEFEPAQARRDARVVQFGPDGALWVAGFQGIFRVEGQRIRIVVPAEELRGGVPVSLQIDGDGTLWAGLTTGLLRAGPARGVLRRYATHDGLPNDFVRVLWRDRDGVLWAGTNGGLARFENGRFLAARTEESAEQESVRSLFEDREGNLWVGTNSGLDCFHDGRFLLFSRLEGLPGDKPTVVHQDRGGAVWIGFHDRGLYRFRPAPNVRYTAQNGLPSNEIFSIRDGAGGALLIGTREGAVEWKNGRFRPLDVPDPLGRRLVVDALEDRGGRLWAAAPGGLIRFEGDRGVRVAGGGASLNDYVISLTELPDGTLWAASTGLGAVGDPRRPDAALHLRRRSASGTGAHHSRGPRRHLVDWHHRSGPGVAPPGPVSPLQHSRRPAQRQHCRNPGGPGRRSVAQHDARHLQGHAVQPGRFRRGPVEARAGGVLRRLRRPAQRPVRSFLPVGGRGRRDRRRLVVVSHGAGAGGAKPGRARATATRTAAAGVPGGVRWPARAASACVFRPGAVRAGRRAADLPIRGHLPARAGGGAVPVPAGPGGPGLGRRRGPAHGGIQQPWTGTLPFPLAGRGRGPRGGEGLRVHDFAAFLPDGVVRRGLRAGASGSGVGRLAASAEDAARPIPAGAGRTRSHGARDCTTRWRRTSSGSRRCSTRWPCG